MIIRKVYLKNGKPCHTWVSWFTVCSWVEPTTGYIDGTWIIARILSNEYQGPRAELVREGVGDVFRYVLECDYLHITNHVEFGSYIALLEQCAAVDPIFHMPF